MRLKIFILSTMLITLISGILFYKNLTQIDTSTNLLRFDVDEIRSIDYQVSLSAFNSRRDLNSDLSELKREENRIKELLELINDINKNTPELKISVEKIKDHFSKRIKQLETFSLAQNELQRAAYSLISTLNQLDKKNIRYMLDKKDFYRECLLDSYMYISFPLKENETRLIEDQKILGQIISFSNEPIPELQRFSEHLNTIQKRVKQIDLILIDMKDTNIDSEMKIITKYYQESLKDKSEQNENLLTFMIAAIGIYLLFMMVILRKN